MNDRPWWLPYVSRPPDKRRARSIRVYPRKETAGRLAGVSGTPHQRAVSKTSTHHVDDHSCRSKCHEHFRETIIIWMKISRTIILYRWRYREKTLDRPDVPTVLGLLSFCCCSLYVKRSTGKRQGLGTYACATITVVDAQRRFVP